jgi:hypothetical protein
MQPHQSGRQPAWRDFEKTGRSLTLPKNHRLFPSLVDRGRGVGRWQTFRYGQREDLRLQANGRFVRERSDPRTGRKTVVAGAWTLQDLGSDSFELVLAADDDEEIDLERVELVGGGFTTGTGANRVTWSATK